MNFEWSLFEFTPRDCQLLAKGLKATPTLKIFRLNRSKVGDQQGRIIVSHLLDHPSLCTLGECVCVRACVHKCVCVILPTFHPSDLSHNKLADGTGRAVGKLLNGHAPKLTSLNVSNNVISGQGGVSIGHALQNNTTLQRLNIKMNNLDDEGVQPFLKALLKNSTLICLDVGSNCVGESTAPALSEVSIFG